MKDEPQSYRAIALRGAAATGAAQVCRILLQIATTLALSRLLEPSDFGVVAMVIPSVHLVGLLQEFGIQQALIQARNLSETQISRMFWINLVLSTTVVALLLPLGPLMGWFYGDPRVVAITMAWSLPALTTSVATHHLSLLNRNLKFETLAIIDVAVSVTTFLVTLVAAGMLRSYWALWISAWSGSIVMFVLASGATQWRPSHPRLHAQTRHLMRFALHITGSNIMNFLSQNSDNILIAKLFGSKAVGLYDMSYKIFLLPISQINAPLGRVMKPILGRLTDDPHRYRETYLTAAAASTWLIVPGISALAIVSSDFVPLLLGEKWAAAAPIFAWLGVAGLSQPLASTAGWLFITQHRTGEMLRWSSFSAASTIASFLVGIPWGVAGMAASYALGNLLLRMPLLFLVVGRHGPVSSRDLLRVQMPMLASAVLSFGVLRLFADRFSPAPWTMVVCAIAISYALAGTFIVMQRSNRRLLAALVKFPIDWLRERKTSRASGASTF
jgi:O-antigen/teichoic acid export membrane protein